MSHKFTMAIIQSNTGTWGYCPAAALPVMRDIMLYTDDGNSPTAEAAEAAALADPTVPRGATFVRYPKGTL